LLAFFRLAFPFEVFAPAVLRRPAVSPVERPPALRAFARAPVAALRFDGGRFCPRALPVVLELFFFAI
jgi:hypothetical protein